MRCVGYNPYTKECIYLCEKCKELIFTPENKKTVECECGNKQNIGCKICGEPLKEFELKEEICRICWLEEEVRELKRKSHVHEPEYKHGDIYD